MKRTFKDFVLQWYFMVTFFVIASILLMIFAWPYFPSPFSKEVADYINNILIGLATGFIGMLITITYVQNALNVQARQNEKIEEYKKIIRCNTYARSLFKDYILYFNQLVTPLEKRDKFREDELITNFSFNDLNGIYDMSILIRDGFYTPAIVSFYQVEKQLISYLASMSKDIDYKYAEKLCKALNDILTKPKEYETREAVLKALITKDGDEKLSDSITNELKNPSRDYMTEYITGRLSSDMMTPIARLFLFLQTEQIYILEYMNEIKNIERELVEIIK